MSLQVFNVSVATIMFSVVDFVSISVAFLVERLDVEQSNKHKDVCFASIRREYENNAFPSVVCLEIPKVDRLDLKQPSCLQKFKQNHIKRLQDNLVHLSVLVDAFALKYLPT